MVTRIEAAATTRSALVCAAADLLDGGGPEAVTLRAVGGRAGVSRGAPYGHFSDKAHLLAQLAVDAWDALAEAVEQLRSDPSASPSSRLERAVLTLVELGRRRPHLYALMFSTPADDVETTRASSRLQEQFLLIVTDLVGEADARRYAALLMSSAHGIATLEFSGHLAVEKWQVDGDQLVHTLIQAIAPSYGHSHQPY